MKQLCTSIWSSSPHGTKATWCTSGKCEPVLSLLRMFHEDQRGDLVRHLFPGGSNIGWLGLVDASIALQVAHLSAQYGPQKTKVCCSRSETLRIKPRGRFSWHCWQSGTLSLPKHEQRIILVGDALGGTVGIHVWSEVNVLEDALSPDWQPHDSA